MLQTLHRTMNAPKPIYGMNRGSVGFLMNEYSERGLRERLAAAKPSIIHPLIMRARDVRGVETDGAGDQRGLAAAPDLSGGQAAHRGRRHDAAQRTDRRRRAGGDAGRLDRLQSLGQRADPAARRAADGADADLALPAPALARRAAARHGARHHRGAGGRQAAGRRRGRPFRDPRASSGSRSRWTARPRSSCCTIPAIRSTSASCASSSATRGFSPWRSRRASSARAVLARGPLRADANRHRSGRGRRRDPHAVARGLPPRQGRGGAALRSRAFGRDRWSSSSARARI